MAFSDPRPGTRIHRAYRFQYVCLVFIRYGTRTSFWAWTIPFALCAWCVHGKCNVLLVLTRILCWRVHGDLRIAFGRRSLFDSEPQTVRRTVQERHREHHLYRG